MDLPMTGNAALAVAATGGAAGAQIDPDPDFPEAMAAVTSRFTEVCRVASSILPWHLSFTDTAAVASLVLLVLAHFLANVVPCDTWADQGWLFSKLIMILTVIYGAFGLTCSLWVKLFRKTIRTTSEGSLHSAISSVESKDELVRRWINNLPQEGHERVQTKENINDSPYIDPVGDGQLLVTEIQVKEFTLAACVSHALSTTPTKTEEVPVDKGEVKATEPAQNSRADNSNNLSLSDRTEATVNALSRPFAADNHIFESGCPGGDVAWATLQVKLSSSHHETSYESCPGEATQQPIITDFVNHITAAPYQPTQENIRPDIEDDSFQDGLNFSPDESPDESESNSPEEDTENAENSSDEPAEVVRVFSKGLLSGYENNSLKQDNISLTLKPEPEPELELVPGPEEKLSVTSYPTQEGFVVAASGPTFRSDTDSMDVEGFSKFSYGTVSGMHPPRQLPAASSTISVGSKLDLTGGTGVDIAEGFSDFSYEKAPGMLPCSQPAAACSNVSVGSKSDFIGSSMGVEVAKGYDSSPYETLPGMILSSQPAVSVGSKLDLVGCKSVEAPEGFSDYPYGKAPGMRPPSQPAGASSALSVTQAFIMHRNTLCDQEYNSLDNHTVEDCPCAYPPADYMESHDYEPIIQPSCFSTCQEHGCTYMSDHEEEKCGNDLSPLERTLPFFSCVPRPMSESEHANKFHLSSIPEDAPLCHHYN